MIETVEIPAEWREHIHPRRGGVAVPEAVLDEGAALRARAWEREARPVVEEMLGHDRTSPELAKAVRARLDGGADPAGAAAVAAVAVRYLENVDGAAFLDAWVLDHGLVFAACAVTEAAAIAIGSPPPPGTLGGSALLSAVPSGGWRGAIRRPLHSEYFAVNEWVAEDAVAKRLRTLLAAASEAEYREAVAELSARRGDRERRAVASYLVPTEKAWMGQSLNDPNSALLEHDHVLASLSTAAHASRIGWIPVTPAVIGTLLDGLGANALPLLGTAAAYDYEDHYGYDYETRPLVLRAMLGVADERLFLTLLDYMGWDGVPAAMREALERYPVHAVRALAPLANDVSTRGLQASGLVRGLLQSAPDLVGEVPPGTAPALLPRPAVPDCDELPAVLQGKAARGAKNDWIDPASLPQILVRGGDRALPADATRRLLVLLARKSPDAAAVRDFCDRHSLAEFSWAVFQRWYGFGAPTRHNWALAQLGLIGDDTTVRRLSPLVKAWPGEGMSSRAASALGVFAAIGSDVALTHLFELTRRGRYKTLKARATQKIDEIAAARGITSDDLADRAVPDFGLDDHGELTLDYGPRRFTVTFDQQLVPLVVEAGGKVRKSAPKPGPNDDPALAPAAHALFAGLRKDLRAIAEQEIRRLEQAMTTLRTWTPADFRALFVTHPLMGHLAHRLVWTTGDGTAFRVAEDRTYADVNDDPFTLAPDARVGIAHPILLDDLEAWVEVFADYEISQPFEQLGRPVHRLTDDERDGHRLTRVEGLSLPYGRARGHSENRWKFVLPSGAPATGWLARRDPEGLYVVADLYPGLGSYMYGEGSDQEITTVWASRSPIDGSVDTVPLGEVHPVTMSEAIHDLTRSALS